MKRKPLIAITARINMRDGIQWIANPIAFFEAIIQAGGIPVMIYYEEDKDDVVIADQFDGLLIPGGSDINPKYYHQEQGEDVEIGEDKVDELDIRLIHAFHRKKKPILGICRGMQCINVAFGGSLYQDIANSFDDISKGNHEQREQGADVVFEGSTHHEIQCQPNSKLYSFFKDEYAVNSFHHQSIDRVAKGFMASAYSKTDRIIEGIEMDDIIGVQWHPEWLLCDKESGALFQHFVNMSGKNIK